jgi:hypothetical protein
MFLVVSFEQKHPWLRNRALHRVVRGGAGEPQKAGSLKIMYPSLTSGEKGWRAPEQHANSSGRNPCRRVGSNQCRTIVPTRCGHGPPRTLETPTWSHPSDKVFEELYRRDYPDAVRSLKVFASNR